MYLYSDPSDDILHPKSEAGAYEWWYFDALDPVSGYGIVAIFYDGLLFSPDYHEAVRKGTHDTASFHPGFSLSIYKGGTTAFYSLASYQVDTATFGGLKNPVSIGKNRVSLTEADGVITYDVHIDETLPSGLRASGVLRFMSPIMNELSQSGDPGALHRWNLIQPGATVSGEIELSSSGQHIELCSFNTKGYHDHNIGLRPLDRDFDDWYWGRIHIGSDTLVWYNMTTAGKNAPVAWLFKNGEVDFSNQVEMVSAGRIKRSIFGLKKVSAWNVTINEEQYQIVEDGIWDNGPFYQRYKVILLKEGNHKVENALPGIAEYIKPDRITASWVRPMIKIRHHRAGGRGNWIQRSLILTRLTW